MNKRFLSIILSILMIVCTIPMNIFSVSAEELIQIAAEQNNLSEEKSLDELKNEAIAEIEAKITEETREIAENAIVEIANAESAEDVNNIKENTLYEMNEIIINTARDEALAAVNAARDAAVTPDARDFDTYYLETAGTLEEIEEFRNSFLDIIAAIDDIILNATEIQSDDSLTVNVAEYLLACSKFIPEKNGVYAFESHSNGDTFGKIYNSDFETVAEDDDEGDDGNFLITVELTAGETYYLCSRFYHWESGSINVTLSTISTECDHQDTKEVEEKASSCTEIGYTAGVFCNECHRWISGHKVIPMHVDVNNDNICDVCGETINEYVKLEKAKTAAIIEVANLIVSAKSPMRYQMELIFTQEPIQLITILEPIDDAENFNEMNAAKQKALDLINAVEGSFAQAWDNAKEIKVDEILSENASNGIAVVKFTPERNGKYIFSGQPLMMRTFACYDSEKNIILYNPAPESITVDLTKGETVYFSTSLTDLNYNGNIDLSLSLVEETCEHNNTNNQAEVSATCTQDGYTAGVYCSDCETWISGHKTIRKGHADENLDRICDTCGETAYIANGTIGDDITWELFFDGTLEINGTGDIVCEGNTPWRSYPEEIKKLVIGEGITSIDNSAFAGCFNMTDAQIPDSMTSIDDLTFSNCLNLENVSIGKGVKSIGYDAFELCLKLKSITIPESVESIEFNAFERCFSLDTVTVMNPDCTFDESVFEDNEIPALEIDEYCKKYIDVLRDLILVSEESADIDYAKYFLDIPVVRRFNIQIEGGMLPEITLFGIKDSTAESYANDIGVKFTDVLAEAKADAIAEINAAKTNASYAIAEKAIADINAATTDDAINTIKTKALTDMAKADADAAAAKALSEAKDEALEAVEAAQDAAISDKAKDVSIYDIFNAATLEEVAAAKAAALSAIASAEKELADAKTAAIAEINNAKTEANATIAEKAIADINTATIPENVTAIKTKALTDMAKADSDAAAAKALAEAKATAIAEINNAKTETNATIAEKAIADINAATTIEAVNLIKTTALSDMADNPTDPEDPSTTCNHMCHKSGFIGFIWKIVRFFNRIFGTNKTCSCGAIHY